MIQILGICARFACVCILSFRVIRIEVFFEDVWRIASNPIKIF